MNGTLKSWLLEGDPAIRYHAMKLLFEDEQSANVERHRTETHGWGKKLLDLQDKTTHQWTGIYSPKWISTHYTLMELKNLGICPMCASFVKGVEVVVKALWPNKGRVNKYRHQDMCIVGMLVSLMTYAQLNSPELEEMVDYILDHQFEDGGWNCRWETKDPKSSSLHTTLSVLEGFSDYLENTYVYRLQDIKNAIPKGQAFILKKHLFRSVKSNEIINQAFLNCPFPSRWKYDILRALTYFAYVKHPYDIRMEEAIQILEEKMRADGTMPKDKAHAGKTHFMLESGRDQSRWNTFRMLFVLKAYRPERYHVLVHH